MDIHEVLENCKIFALRIIVLHKYLIDHKNEHIMSARLLESATTTGLHVRELAREQPKADLNAALRAADESAYWLELLYGSNYLDKEQFGIIYPECSAIFFQLMALSRTPKKK
ncbi:MAG: four helix bundle protein [Oscillospiraceae bacterium]|nr:four helix bundle protein [Oscillospiraceae bacterium]